MNIRIIASGLTLLFLPLVLSEKGHAQTGAGAEASAAAAASGQRGSLAAKATVEAGLPAESVKKAYAEARERGESSRAADRSAMEVDVRLRGAREALTSEERGRYASDAEIIAGASAMSAGAERTELEALRDAAPRGRSLVVSLETLARLRTTGSSHGAEAAHVIAGHLAAGASDRQVSALGSASHAAGASSSAGATVSGAVRATSGLGSGLGIGAGVIGSAGIGIIR